MERQHFIFPVIVFMLFLVVAHTAILTNSTDQISLIAFKNLLADTNNVLTSNWSTETSFCNWFGVTCSFQSQRVTALSLPSLNLQGTISPSIANLSHLVVLNLSSNNFYGSIPYGIGSLPRLSVIDVGNNQLEGNIPSSLFHNQKIQTISLALNKFTGNIWEEPWNLPELRVLYLTSNNLTGAISPSVGNLTRLVQLDLSSNQLTGSIPPTIFSISSLREIYLENNAFSGPFKLNENIKDSLSSLEVIDLSSNNLTGEIPSSLCQFRALNSLDFSHNNFWGQIPRNIGCLAKLEELYLTSNQINGTIPPSLVNISGLQFLGCVDNHIEGHIPAELGTLSKLKMLGFDYNNLTGEIPHNIFNISSLVYIAFTFNRLSGQIPVTTGSQLPNLKGIFLADNLLSGEFPLSISNASKLVELELSYNFFTGSVPSNLGNLRDLQFLNLAANQLTNAPGSHKLGFLNSMVECRMLQFIILGNQPLNGILPESVGNLSNSIQMFNIENGRLEGNIPPGIGNLSSIITLCLNGNDLTGNIPSEIGELNKLQRLYLQQNKLRGPVPGELCHLMYLGELLLSENELWGSLPGCVGNLSQLQRIFLGSNQLSFTLPYSLWQIKTLLLVNFSSNSLQGELPPTIGQMKVLDGLDLSRNLFSGAIPSTMGDLSRLTYLSLSKNSLQGSIPTSFGNLISLEFLDLSSNALSGAIPGPLENLLHLRDINLSFNQLSGEIPSGGVFANISFQSLIDNKELCGLPRLQLAPCASNTSREESRTKKLLLKCILPVISSSILSVAMYSLWTLHRRKKVGKSHNADLTEITVHPMISYRELQKATENFSGSNLLGVGGSGSVYKGILSDGSFVAVKVFNLQNEEAFQRFDVECDVMRNIRHRNLVKVITSCSSHYFRAIVLEYMPNGNLENWLHGPNCHLDLPQRISIMLDVAMALEYLHHDSNDPVVHCDLKPSNVLLDEDMVAHVSDFGISKILAENRNITQTRTLGTMGYIAPEYGSEGIVSTHGDVYSFGIMLMETITRRKPTHEMFTEQTTLRQWVGASYLTSVMEISDGNLFKGEDEVSSQEMYLSSVLELALECSKEVPEERINMKDVVVRLKKIQEKLLDSKNVV